MICLLTKFQSRVSHLLDFWYTDDFAYGRTASALLALEYQVLAIQNAANYEFLEEDVGMLPQPVNGILDYAYAVLNRLAMFTLQGF